MIIGIDVSQIAHEGTGVARFTYGLIESILEHDNKHQWKFLYYSLRKPFPTKLKKKIVNKGYKLYIFPLPPTLVSILWNDWHRLPVDYIVGKLDWFISSDWVEPPSLCKKATVVHDLVFRRFPEMVPLNIASNQSQRLKWAAQESTIIFTDSLSTLHDLRHFYKVKGQTVVNYPGIRPVETSNQLKCNQLKHKLKLKHPFFLTVGKLEPRKNISRLVEAFQSLEESVELVIVGPTGWGDQITINDQRIKLTGYLSDQDLACLYKECLAFVYPSLYEGFGYPPLEAMQYGAPVLISKVASLPEIGGKVAFYCDPNSTADITHKLRILASQPDLRSKMSNAAQIQVQQFTWEKYYNNLINSLQNYE